MNDETEGLHYIAHEEVGLLQQCRGASFIPNDRDTQSSSFQHSRVVGAVPYGHDLLGTQLAHHLGFFIAAAILSHLYESPTGGGEFRIGAVLRIGSQNKYLQIS